MAEAFNVQFRMKGSTGAWWYLGAYEMLTDDPAHALDFSTRREAVECLEEVAGHFRAYVPRVRAAR